MVAYSQTWINWVRQIVVLNMVCCDMSFPIHPVLIAQAKSNSVPSFTFHCELLRLYS